MPVPNDTSSPKSSQENNGRNSGGISPPIQEPMEADVADVSDHDSTLGISSGSSETTSLASSIARYRLENGRTYHSYKDGSYIAPNDEGENDRLDIQHHSCCLAFGGKLFICPAGISEPLGRVLDAGCGTGIWAVDMADEFPEAEVVGVDLSPIQPTFVPPNVSFHVDDLELEWAYSKPFDLINMRFLMGSITDWEKLYRQAFKNLNPGGWVEVLDAMYPMTSDDGTVTKDQAGWKWGKFMDDACKKLGRSLSSAEANRQRLIDAGFTNVTQSVYKFPINTWPRDPKQKELGAWTFENVVGGLSGMSLRLFTRVLGWEPEELERFLVDVRKDMRNKEIHGYWKILVFYGQKPE